jgi:ubiquinone/menaquinone biosynthesis C-methylase UbiE
MSAQTSKPQPTVGVPEEWVDDHLATIFIRWHPFMSQADVQSQDLVIAEAGIQPGDTVLDVACGAGIPALRIAERVGPDGRIVATDPSPVFLAATAENAARERLTNLDTVQASAAALPFRPGSFDAATCHFGVMFFTDITAGLTRIRETLKPGKRAAFIAWGPDPENQLFSAFGSVASQYAPPPPPPDPSIAEIDIPKPNRFAGAGSLSAALQSAGYRDIRERYEQVDYTWPGHTPSMLAFWKQLSRIEERIPPERWAAFEQDLSASIGRYAEGETLHFRCTVVVASGAA